MNDNETKDTVPGLLAQIQFILKKEGYYTGPIDGKGSSYLKRAVVAFEKDHMMGSSEDYEPYFIENRKIN